MRMLPTLIAALATLVFTGAQAQQPNDGSAPETSAFKGLDKNNDGSLSPAEVAGNKEIAKRFKAFDANKDGKLQEPEYLKAAQDNTKRVAADSAITTKVKSGLLFAKGIPSTAISVETYEGRVQLSGFVENKDQIATAGKIAGDVSSVKKVQNDLKVK
ncbi:MAG: BON domain-containing protein [Ramlibacter sp.]|jgi:hyperosmotically inducible protein|nr:BON domain-containing protein [Ramlibacter sp.]